MPAKLRDPATRVRINGLHDAAIATALETCPDQEEYPGALRTPDGLDERGLRQEAPQKVTRSRVAQE